MVVEKARVQVGWDLGICFAGVSVARGVGYRGGGADEVVSGRRIEGRKLARDCWAGVGVAEMCRWLPPEVLPMRLIVSLLLTIGSRCIRRRF